MADQNSRLYTHTLSIYKTDELDSNRCRYTASQILMREPDASDALDEIEAFVLGHAPSHRVMPVDLPNMEPELKLTEASNPLVEIFQSDGIRILGSVKKPLFCASDVAAHIGDINYRRTLKNYEIAATKETGKYIHMIPACDSIGRTQNTMYLSENGLYRYLLRSDLEKAVAFQVYVYDLLTAERERIVDSIVLAMKIANTRKEEYKKIAESANLDRKIARNEVDSTMRVANLAREELRKTQAYLQYLQSQKRGEVGLRVAANEEFNKTKSWMETYRKV